MREKFVVIQEKLPCGRFIIMRVNAGDNLYAGENFQMRVPPAYFYFYIIIT